MALLAAPESAAVIAAAFQIQRNAGQHQAAGQLASQLSELDSEAAAQIATDAFDSFLRAGEFGRLEIFLSRVTQDRPDAVAPRRLFAQWLNAQGRRFEASQHVRHLIRLRAVTPLEVLSLVDLIGPFDLVRFDDLDLPKDESLLILGDARKALASIRPDFELLSQLVAQIQAKHADVPAASAFVGRYYAETGDWPAMEPWRKQLPKEASDHPEFWHAMACWFRHHGQPDEAIGCWLEALRLDPTMRMALRELIETMEENEAASEAQSLRNWLADLDKVYRIARDADAQQATWISGRLNQWLRPWESSAWIMIAAQKKGNFDAGIVQQLERRREQLLVWEQKSDPQQILDARLARQLDFPRERWPKPSLEISLASIDVDNDPKLQTGNPDDALPTTAMVRLTDVARLAGVQVLADTGYRVETKTFHPYQANGCGLAVGDLDLDGLCDLVVMQADGPPNDEMGSQANQIFRGDGAGRFQEITTFCGAIDRGYGQGVCVGDVNQDGFPDLLFANIGRNRLFLNQGDGTFRNSPDQLDDAFQSWTSSLGLADLDGDAVPELIEINYIDDPRALSDLCRHPYDECQPQSYSPAADRVYQLSPDGRFYPWKSMCDAMGATPKFGFGLIVANFDAQAGLDFFVTNDGDFNHFWKSVRSEGSDDGDWVEASAVAGLAVGRNGNSQACMGVAADDFNRDGRLDLHVTNFYKESVNLFLQTSNGFFSDQPERYKLEQVSKQVLGFGTQAVDINNDGWSDLITLNGHLFDRDDGSTPFQMLPQIFIGDSTGFRLHDRSDLSEYWSTPQLGRTLAQGDIDRDGRLDLLANHLDHPVALLINQSESGHWLQLELVGTQSERDAIGAVVQLSGDKSAAQTKWMLGGDGYMCSNESMVHFGLDQINEPVDITIQWPSGVVQVIRDMELDHRYLIVETQSPELR